VPRGSRCAAWKSQRNAYRKCAYKTNVESGVANNQYTVAKSPGPSNNRTMCAGGGQVVWQYVWGEGGQVSGGVVV